MASLSVEERAMIASRYEVWKSRQLVQDWWCKEKNKHESLRRETIIKWHKRLMEMGSVCDARRQRVSPSRSEVNIAVVRKK